MPIKRKEIAGLPSDFQQLLNFQGVLFALLLTYVIVEFPLKQLYQVSTPLLIRFSALYLFILANIFLHWWSLQYDLNIQGIFYPEKITIGRYALSLFVAIVYVLFTKILLFLIDSPDNIKWSVRAFSILFILYHYGDVVFHVFVLPKQLGKLLAHNEKLNTTQRSVLKDWYMSGLGSSISFYSFPIVVILLSLFRPIAYFDLVIIILVIFQIWLELRLFSQRSSVFAIIEGLKMSSTEQLPKQNHFKLTREPYILGFYFFVIALTLAYFEVQIEGPHGWAAGLPTWRINDPTITWIFGGRDVTGYHVSLNLLLVLFLHLPFVLQKKWSFSSEAKILSLFALLGVSWDFLWFIWNPNYGFSQYTPEHVTWFKNWFLGVPVDYFFGILASFILRCLPSIFKKEPFSISIPYAITVIAFTIFLVLSFSVIYPN